MNDGDISTETVIEGWGGLSIGDGGSGGLTTGDGGSDGLDGGTRV